MMEFNEEKIFDSSDVDAEDYSKEAIESVWNHFKISDHKYLYCNHKSKLCWTGDLDLTNQKEVVDCYELKNPENEEMFKELIKESIKNGNKY